MIERAVETTLAARWALPVRTTTDSETQTRHENESLTSGYSMIDNSAAGHVRSSISWDESVGRVLVRDLS